MRYTRLKWKRRSQRGRCFEHWLMADCTTVTKREGGVAVLTCRSNLSRQVSKGEQEKEVIGWFSFTDSLQAADTINQYGRKKGRYLQLYWFKKCHCARHPLSWASYWLTWEILAPLNAVLLLLLCQILSRQLNEFAKQKQREIQPKPN